MIAFFGVIPVTLTCYLQTGTWDNIGITLPTSFATGLLAANVLVVNNYRDMEDDTAVGKRTTVVIFGRRIMSHAYLISGAIAMAAMFPVWKTLPMWSLAIPFAYLALHIGTWQTLKRSTGSQLNPLLGRTAINLLFFTLMLLIASITYQSM